MPIVCGRDEAAHLRKVRGRLGLDLGVPDLELGRQLRSVMEVWQCGSVPMWVLRPWGEWKRGQLTPCRKLGILRWDLIL